MKHLPTFLLAALLMLGQSAQAQYQSQGSYQIQSGQQTGPTVNVFGPSIVANTAHNEITGTDGFVNDGVHSTSLSTFYSTAGGFTAGLVGRNIVIDGCGPDGTDLATTVAAVPTSNTITLTTACSMVVPWWGVGRAYHGSYTDVTASYAVNDLLSVSGGTAVAATTGTAVFSNTSAVIAMTNTLVPGARIQFTSSGTLPTNFSLNTIYYVLNTGLSASDFEVGLTVNSDPIVAGSAGSGTQTAQIEPGTGVFKVITLEASKPVVASGGTGGANGTCTLFGYNAANANQDDGVTRTNWGTLATLTQPVPTNGFFTVSGTVSGGIFATPVIVEPGDYTTMPKAATVAPVTVTFTNSSALVAGTNTYAAGDTVEFTTTGGLPTNFTASTVYYVLPTNLTGAQFEVSATFGGAAITAGSAGTGVDTSTSVQVMTPVSGCVGLVGAALTLKAGPHAMLPTTFGHYTALPSTSGTWSTTGGSGSGATLQPFGLGTTGLSTAVYGDPIGGHWAIGTDDTAAVNTAIATLMTLPGVGGTVVLPAGRSLMLGPVVIPYTGTNPPLQPPVTITGAGGIAPVTKGGGYTTAYNAGVVGSILDNRYSGASYNGSSYVAKIDTRGMGVISIHDISMVDWGTDNFLVFQTTNTLPRINTTAFIGNGTCYQQTCMQPMLRIGAIDGTETFSTNAAISCFQANAPSFRDDYFGFAWETMQVGCAANQMVIENEQVDSTSGSALTGALHYYGAGAGSLNGVVLTSEIEAQGYPYTVYMDHIGSATNSGHTFLGVAGFDGSGGTVGHNGLPTVGGYYMDANSNYNMIFSSPEGDYAYDYVTQLASPATNTVLTGANNPAAFFAGILQIGSRLGIGTTNPIDPLDVGAGTGNIIGRLNGGNSGTSGGGCLAIANGGVTYHQFGNRSACEGGSFSYDTVTNDATGLNCQDTYSIDYICENDKGGIPFVSMLEPLYTNTGATTITSGNCGTTTNGTVAGDNMAGTITIGAVATTTCTVNFSTTLNQAPRAVTLTPGNAAAAALGTGSPYISPAPTTAHFILNAAALASTVWYYHVY